MAAHDWRQPTGYVPPGTPYQPGNPTPMAQPTGQPGAAWPGQPATPQQPTPGQPVQGQVPQAQQPQGQYPQAHSPQQAYPQSQAPQQAYPQAQYPQAQPWTAQPQTPQPQVYPQPNYAEAHPATAAYAVPHASPQTAPVDAGFPHIDLGAGQADRKPPAKSAALQQAQAQQLEDDEFEDDDDGWKLPSVSAAPPWVVSLVTHMAILLLLALLVIPFKPDRNIRLEAVFSSDLGEQLQSMELQSMDDPLDVPNPMLSLSDRPEVDDPLAAPPAEVPDDYVGETSLSDMAIPNVGLALSGRTEGMKRALLARYGGNAQTELAVEEALKWLQRNQEKEGSWSMMGPYSDGGTSENRVSATAMALLAFQGAGHTHLEGAYKKEVADGWDYLFSQMDANGDFWTTGTPHHRLYSQAQATIALCELYGMSEDPELQTRAQTAINFAVRSQSPEGGWRYSPGDDSDTSVTGWFVMALQSGLMAGLEVPPATLSRVNGYLDSAASENGSRYGYTSGGIGTPPMTAEGLLCRQYLGWEHDDPRLQAGVEYISANPINYVGNNQNVYYWYYATQVTHHMEGPTWTEWNRVLREALPEAQTMEGAERGSWNPGGDRWGVQIGRLYTTCLSTYMLEVYYRHLPVYSNLYDEEVE